MQWARRASLMRPASWPALRSVHLKPTRGRLVCRAGRVNSSAKHGSALVSCVCSIASTEFLLEIDLLLDFVCDAARKPGDGSGVVLISGGG